MDSLVSNEIGLLHLVTAVIALITGTMVITNKKGTLWHKKTGYIYVGSMVIMLATSFMLYNLFGRFAIFHYFSIVSTITLVGGMIPAYRRKTPSWVEFHFAFMYWSVLGLYAAFVAEVITRVPETPFFGMLGVAIFLVMSLGYFFWFKYKKIWSTQFKSSVGSGL